MCFPMNIAKFLRTARTSKVADSISSKFKRVEANIGYIFHTFFKQVITTLSLRIQSECGKTWSRKTRNTDTFYTVHFIKKLIKFWIRLKEFSPSFQPVFIFLRKVSTFYLQLQIYFYSDNKIAKAIMKSIKNS